MYGSWCLSLRKLIYQHTYEAGSTRSFTYFVSSGSDQNAGAAGAAGAADAAGAAGTEDDKV